MSGIGDCSLDQHSVENVNRIEIDTKLCMLAGIVVIVILSIVFFINAFRLQTAVSIID